jgi:hypothetical protein
VDAQWDSSYTRRDAVTPMLQQHLQAWSLTTSSCPLYHLLSDDGSSPETKDKLLLFASAACGS